MLLGASVHLGTQRDTNDEFGQSLNTAKHTYRAPEFAVDYVVVGGGVVGLAVARRLSRIPNKTTLLLERHSKAGEETSSRNSEVIHSGLYYPPDSLKTHLCIRGRELLYAYCKANQVPFRQTGKLVVASEKQHGYIEGLHAKAQMLKWPTSFGSATPDRQALPTELISGSEARQMEPHLSRDISGALWCPETGIIDSHALMESLERDIIDSDGADLVYSTKVVRLDPFKDKPTIDGAKRGWVIQTVTGDEIGSIYTKSVINAMGLSAPLLVNSLLPESKRLPLYYARGSYAKYRGRSVSGISHLIYPCPDNQSHGFQSLGTHLTLDLQGEVRFGPDLQWISPKNNDDSDFWKKYLVADNSRLEEMHQAVTKYLPSVELEGLQPDYVGIRPKLVGPGGGFQDFIFRTDFPDKEVEESAKRPFISLLGIESPGLTSALGIAEHVVSNMLGEQ